MSARRGRPVDFPELSCATATKMNRPFWFCYYSDIGTTTGAGQPPELLALKLDEDTNNTSLVLAFELLESGKVLLFPGDAQVGSWLSWDALEWIDPTLSNRRITSRELLEQTVLYKVSQHGSYNATARAQGLERMSSPELSALLPVYEDQAKRKGWETPAPALYRKLLEKTSGRILRMDRGGDELWLDVTILS